jgi:hypothetical protein
MSKIMSQSHALVRPFHAFAASLLLAVLSVNLAHAAAKPSLTIKSAAYNKKTASLVVKTTGNAGGGLLSLIHSQGGVLGQSSDSEHIFTIPQAQLGEIPCQVEARVGEQKISKAVAGASAECKKVPICKLLTPASNISVNANTPTRFEAQVTLKDKKAAPLTIEWDFAGGAMGHPYEKLLKDGKPITNGKVSTEASFIRDNSSYHVRFTAHDNLGRRCEAGVNVVVGQIPSDLPNIKPLAEAAQQSAPKRASGLGGDKVVIPFERRSMQNSHDSALLPRAPLVYAPQFNTIQAYVYEKGLQPKLVNNEQVELTYAAASNPADPVGPNSINSTSQSWPIGDANDKASLKKGELIERYNRPDKSNLAPGYYSSSLIDALSGYSGRAGQHQPLADEGAYFLNTSGDPFSVDINPDHGRYMPGINKPYVENTPQAFSEFTSLNNWFTAYWLPLTDIDDSGRVNPTSLYRIHAVDKDTKAPLATTDVTVTASKDFHCRECHTVGQIGAKDIERQNRMGDKTKVMLMPTTINDSVETQEYAALQNMKMLHVVYDFMSSMNMGTENPITFDGPSQGCVAGGMCHGNSTSSQIDQNYIRGQYSRTTQGGASNAMHRMHGTLQYNDDKSDIQRDETGRYLCGTDVTKTNCVVDPNKSLFPVKDANGKILPMEENCLKCHSGQREQCYRDRMFTAGVTCYQCHGDMLAVGQVYPKAHVNPDGNPYRLQWLDQPDCGSCHTGSGNVGKDATKGYFSAGVKTLAFAENDPSATPNKVDLTNPDERRFAVVPLTELKGSRAAKDNDYNAVLRTPLYRLGKDSHGQVNCAACHGPAHSVWPNRDPNANDNVTALELQGHTGTLLECNVCHTPDSFAQLLDNDEGHLVADAKEGVLGGPHSLHPVNDPYWWKSAAGDVNSDGSSSGGWHNNYAQKPGNADEDQCAACHGNDHKGTRLSRTPVDRVFDFSGVADLKQLKKAGIKTKVSVKAGTPIGCDTCHSVELSCKGSPNSSCGQASEQVTVSGNQAPYLSPGIVNAVIGGDFSQQLTFSDPEKDEVFVDTVANHDGQFDLNAGVLSLYPWVTPAWAATVGGQQDPQNPNAYLRPPFDYDIQVLLTDYRGASATRTLTVRLTCPEGQTWDQASQYCTALTLYSYAPSGGLNAGPDWIFPVLAESATGLPLTYSLVGPIPAGMSIDAQGKITWKTSEVASTGDQSATVRVADNAGNQAEMAFTLSVCKAPMHWNAETASCVGSVRITSDGPSTSNQHHYSYQLVWKEESDRPVTFSLIDAPAGFVISPVGLISGDPSLSMLGGDGPLQFTVQVAVSPDNWARQTTGGYVCSGSTLLSTDGSLCGGPTPILFSSSSISLASANQPFSYQTGTTNSNNNLPVTYSLLGALPGMTIDSNTGIVTWNSTGYVGQSLSFGIVARDASGGWAAMKNNLTVCPANKPISDPDTGICVYGPIKITSKPGYGANAKQVFHYQVKTSTTDSVPVSLSLDGAPSGMTLDGNGLISWNTTGAEGQYVEFRITASDSQGAWTQQTVTLNVCTSDTPTWDPGQLTCVP